MAKTTVIFTGLAITGVIGALWAIDKKDKIEHVVDQLEFQLRGVKRFKFSFKKISMDVYLRAINPTSSDLKINTGFVKATVLRMYEKSSGKLLAYSNLNTTKIQIPQGGHFDLPPVHLEVESLTGAQYLLDQLGGQNEQELLKRFRFELELSILGKITTIKF